MPWNVPAQVKAADANTLDLRAALTMRSTRRAISVAARRENVSRKDAARIGAVDHDMRDAVSERVRLA